MNGSGRKERRKKNTFRGSFPNACEKTEATPSLSSLSGAPPPPPPPRHQADAR